MSTDFNSSNNIDPDANHYSELYPSLEGDINSQYYDSGSYKASQPSSSNEDFSLIYLNINSLGANGGMAFFYVSYQV